MNRAEASFHLAALKTELPRLEFPVSCNCTEEIREEFRDKVMEALDVAISVLCNPGAADKSARPGN